MKRYPKIRRLVKVAFTPQEFIKCVNTVESTMRQMGTRDPQTRLEMIGGYFGDVEKGLAFSARMNCMMEMHNSPRMAAFSTKDPNTGRMTSSLGMFHAAALAPLHYDDDCQYFDENEFFEIADIEKRALSAAEPK
jgi:hypothetical protein